MGSRLSQQSVVDHSLLMEGYHGHIVQEEELHMAAVGAHGPEEDTDSVGVRHKPVVREEDIGSVVEAGPIAVGEDIDPVAVDCTAAEVVDSLAEDTHLEVAHHTAVVQTEGRTD